MGKHDHIGLTLDEAMAGWVGVGHTDPVDGRMAGQVRGTRLEMRSHITIASLTRFIEQPDHAGTLEGTITFGPLGTDMPARDGVFNVFVVDPRTGERQMIYETRFTSAAGRHYFLHGIKHIADDPGSDVVEDMTTLFTTLYEGDDSRGRVYGAGQLFFSLADAPALLAALKVTGQTWFGQALAAKVAFLSFAFGAVRDTYLADLNPLYDASYQNVILQGQARDAAGNPQPFFLVSGVHSPNFPWGDGGAFGDLLLLVGDPAARPRRFAITDRRLAGQTVDIAGGALDYDGPIFDLTDRPCMSFSEMHGASPPAPAGRVKLAVRFTATAHPLAPFPFRISSQVLDKLAYRVRETLRRLLPSERQFGFQIVPHTLSGVSGSIVLQAGDGAETLTIDGTTAVGEAEDSTIRNVREPTLLYGYICVIRQAARAARVQFHTSTLRNEREYWGKDRIDALLGAVISHFASRELDIRPGGVTVTDLAEPAADGKRPPLFETLGAPLLQVDNDHFATAGFQRKIIAVKDPSGDTCLALEEAMDTVRREPIDCTRETVVASIRGDDKLAALDEALQSARFWESLDAGVAASGKTKQEFSVVIKPNFMFAYNRADHTTYTDPGLVDALVARLRAHGFSRITVVEAQSTYGEYFTNRGVRDVAAYLGYAVDGSRGYDVVDLTTDRQVHRHFGPALGYHPVPVTWRDADFRVSFAKNKTHSYAFYTLTIKNVYGALPLGNKLKEYHCDRGIYDTTVEYLAAYPVHFGIIDAWSSADGPFGIFADAEPNDTRTIIAGADLVAVDWVGASRMGLDPKISNYMKLAVRAFGKPRIRLVGDASLYRPWLNVPLSMSLLAHFGLDANHYFANLVYMSAAYMDETQFAVKSRSAFIRAVRAALRPIQEAVFLLPGGERTEANRALGRLLTWLGS